MNLTDFEKIFAEKVSKLATPSDPAHDILHFQRVVQTAKFLCQQEGGRMEIVLPAAWLHDFVIVPKDDPRRSQASRLSAMEALKWLREISYPEELHEDVAHAIEAHSFSAGLETRSVEARIVQDADRLDALGAIGIARCFATAGILKRPFYSFEDPWCSERAPNDQIFTIDHFYVKLFKVAESLKTNSGRQLGKQRLEFMKQFLIQMKWELN